LTAGELNRPWPGGERSGRLGGGVSIGEKRSSKKKADALDKIEERTGRREMYTTDHALGEKKAIWDWRHR